MKAAVVYSTLTGNTKKVAEAFASGLGSGAETFDVNAAPADIPTRSRWTS